MGARSSGDVRLYIGDVARLLGVTTKTIRHYHRAGLLDEPARTPSGYRVYSAADLVRLVRIRQLQALGLKLDEVGHILCAQPEERQVSVRAALTALAGALDEQIAALQARRARLASLLADPALDLSEQPTETPETLRWARAELGDQLQGMSPALLAQEARILGTIDAVRWPGDTMARLRDAERALASQPESYRQMILFMEQWAALADEPSDSPRVEAFIASVKASGALDGARSLVHSLPGFTAGPTEALLADVLRATLTPAQHRILEALGDAFGANTSEKEAAQ